MSYVVPMGYFLAGCMKNEFKDNDTALGEWVWNAEYI